MYSSFTSTLVQSKLMTSRINNNVSFRTASQLSFVKKHKPPLTTTTVPQTVMIRLGYLKMKKEPQQLLIELSHFIEFGNVPMNNMGLDDNLSDPPTKTNPINVPSISISLYHLALWALGQAGCPDRALVVMSEIENDAKLAIDSRCWAYYITACGNNRDVERIRQAMAAIKVVGPIRYSPHILEAAIQAYAQCAEFDRAMCLVRQLYQDHHLDHHERSSLAYNLMKNLLHILVTAHRSSDVAELFSFVNKDIPPMTMWWWADWARSLAQFNHHELCQLAIAQVLKQSVRNHELVDEGTLNACLELAGRTGNTKLAVDMYNFITRRCEIHPSMHQLSCLVLAFGRARDYKAVNMVFARMRGFGYDPVHAAMSLLEPMNNIGQQCLNSPDSFMFHLQRPIQSYEHWMNAESVMNKLVLHNVKIDSAMFGWLIDASRRIQRSTLGLMLYKRRHEYNVDVDHFVMHAALACCRSHSDRNAVLRDMAAINLEANVHTYLTMIRLILKDLEYLRTEYFPMEDDVDPGSETSSTVYDFGDVSADWIPLMETLPATNQAKARECIDQAFVWLKQAQDFELVDHRALLLLLRTCVRWSDDRWRHMAELLVQSGVSIDLKTIKMITIAYPTDPLATYLTDTSACRKLRIGGARLVKRSSSAHSQQDWDDE